MLTPNVNGEPCLITTGDLNMELDAARDEIKRLRAALAKIADWDSNWGPFPENNEAWRAMVVVTAREAVPELGPKDDVRQHRGPVKPCPIGLGQR